MLLYRPHPTYDGIPRHITKLLIVWLMAIVVEAFISWYILDTPQYINARPFGFFGVPSKEGLKAIYTHQFMLTTTSILFIVLLRIVSLRWLLAAYSLFTFLDFFFGKIPRWNRFGWESFIYEITFIRIVMLASALLLCYAASLLFSKQVKHWGTETSPPNGHMVFRLLRKPLIALVAVLGASFFLARLANAAAPETQSSPLQAQHAISSEEPAAYPPPRKDRFDPRTCSTDVEGTIHIALWEKVMRFRLDDIEVISEFTPPFPSRAPQPKNPEEPEGCPGNPMRATFVIFNADAPGLKAVLPTRADGTSIAPSKLRIHSLLPEVAENRGAVVQEEERGGKRRYGTLEACAFDNRYRLFHDVEELPSGLHRCLDIGKLSKSAAIPGNWRYSFKAPPDVHTTPSGLAFRTSCGNQRNNYDRCRYYYLWPPEMRVYVDFNASVPHDRIIAMDRAIQAYLRDAIVPEYEWKRNALSFQEFLNAARKASEEAKSTNDCTAREKFVYVAANAGILRLPREKLPDRGPQDLAKRRENKKAAVPLNQEHAPGCKTNPHQRSHFHYEVSLPERYHGRIPKTPRDKRAVRHSITENQPTNVTVIVEGTDRASPKRSYSSGAPRCRREGLVREELPNGLVSCLRKEVFARPPEKRQSYRSYAPRSVYRQPDGRVFEISRESGPIFDGLDKISYRISPLIKISYTLDPNYFDRDDVIAIDKGIRSEIQSLIVAEIPWAVPYRTDMQDY